MANFHDKEVKTWSQRDKNECFPIKKSILQLITVIWKPSRVSGSKNVLIFWPLLFQKGGGKKTESQTTVNCTLAFLLFRAATNLLILKRKYFVLYFLYSHYLVCCYVREKVHFILSQLGLF